MSWVVWNLCDIFHSWSMMRTASVSKIDFLVDNWLYFSQEASKSDHATCVVELSLPDLSIKLSFFAFECTRDVELDGTQKCSQVGVKHDLCGQSPHLAYHCTPFGPSFLQSAILGPHENHSTPSLVHHQWSFTVSCFSLPWVRAIRLPWVTNRLPLYPCRFLGPNSYYKIL